MEAVKSCAQAKTGKQSAHAGNLPHLAIPNPPAVNCIVAFPVGQQHWSK